MLVGGKVKTRPVQVIRRHLVRRDPVREVFETAIRRFYCAVDHDGDFEWILASVGGWSRTLCSITTFGA